MFLLAEIKHRSSSLDHSAYSHRRRLQNRPTAPIRTPYVLEFSKRIFTKNSSFSESDDEQTHLPIRLIDLNNDSIKQNNKLVL